MTECPSANELAQLLDGTISTDRRIAVERHLDRCLACTDLVAELARGATAGVTIRSWQANRTRAEVVAMWRRVVTKLATSSTAHGALSPDCIAVDDDEIAIGSAHAAPSPYTAVEQLHGAGPSLAADQFALCASMWEALAGKRPFHGTTPGALAVVMMTPPDPPDRDPIYGTLARGLAADPAARWPDLAALARALDDPPRRSARFRWLIAVVLVIVAAGATWWIELR